jgi:hypothetical protein
MSGKRISSLLGKIAVLFVIYCSCLPVQAKYGGGSGTSDYPYLIYDANQMNAIGADQSDWDKNFKLMADINLIAFTGNSFNIIGERYYDSRWIRHPFTGVFDGNGHMISNFTYDSNGTNHIGIFGYVHDCEIKNLGLIDPNVDAGIGIYVGSLVGRNEGTITNCYVEGGSVSGTGDVGGLVGSSRGKISNCYSRTSVSGNSKVGGLVGYSSRCIITNCYSTGTVSGNWGVGGLVGENDEFTISTSFWDIETSGQTNSDGGTGKTTAEMKTASTFVGWGCGSIWIIDSGKDYPRLWWQNMPGEIISKPYYGGGNGEPNDPYLIYSAEMLNTIGLAPCDWDKHFRLMADIDLSGYTGTSFNIIGADFWDPFTGVFDGNGHKISNFTYSSTGTDNIGLFGYDGGVIKDLGLIDAEVDAGTGDYVGVLVGWKWGGTITNCYVEGGSISGGDYVGGLVGDGSNIINCYATTSVSGSSYVGGLVGTGSNIANCYATGDVSGDYEVGGLMGMGANIANCYAGSTVSGISYVGGLLGINGNPGAAGTTLANCYSTGSVTGTTDVGGLVGWDGTGGSVFYCFWDIETSGQNWSDGGTGLPTAQMQNQNTFIDAGWDFVGETYNGIDDIWFIPQGDYTHLWWEGMQVPMKLTPRTLNCRSEGNWVKAHLTMPEGFTVEDVDPDRPAVLRSFGFESASLYVFVNKDKLVQIEAAFERQAVCSLGGDWPRELTVAGFLADGNIFLGTSKVRINHPGMNVIEDLAWYWLNADCVHSYFCNDIDMNRDSLVNLADYALLMNIEVEFVTDE